jgi:signal transduction histidine kinase
MGAPIGQAAAYQAYALTMNLRLLTELADQAMRPCSGKGSRIRMLHGLLALLFWSFALAAYSAPPQKTVVVISTEDLSAPPFNTAYESFKLAMRAGLKDSVSIYSENLDFIHFGGAAYQQRLNAWLRNKYAGQKVDVLVTVGSGALKFVAESRPQIWPDVPVVFTAITANALKTIQLPQHVTGVVGELRLEDTVHLSRTVLPKVKRLALVGNAPERDEYRTSSANELAALSKEMEFIDLRGRMLEDVQQRVAGLPADAAVFFTRFSGDGTGRVFESSDVLASLVKIANRPILVNNPASVGTGPLGGVVSDTAALGRQLADYVQKILAGKRTSELAFTVGATGPVLDWRQLKRWDVDTALVPPGAEVRFHQPSLWEEYREDIIAVVALILVQSALVVALLVERRRRAIAVKGSRRHLAELAHMNRNAAANVYSAAMAHELNQPLAAIMSNTEAAELLLQMEPPALAEVKTILADIRRDDRRASDLIQRMRTTLKKSNPEIEQLDINDVIVKVLEFLASEAKMRNVQLHSDMAPRDLPVMADLVQLKQVLVNLVLNSMDAMSRMPASRRVITIRSALQDAKYAEVAVVDSGSGFGSNIDHVFESFFTTKSHGMGLGLSISASIIEAHGGTIHAENAPAGGAIVRFRLPLQTRDKP